MTPSFEVPDPGLIVLIGPSGSGKSTLAATWPDTDILSLDTFRGIVSGDPGCQDATPQAVALFDIALECRMQRRVRTVLDCTNVDQAHRAGPVAAAKRNGMPTAAIVMSTPWSVCVDRQQYRPANRQVDQDVVRAQHTAMVHSTRDLAGEGFDHVVYSDALYRLEPFLQRLSQQREADLGRGCHRGLGDLLVVQRFFGPRLVPLWKWKDGSRLAEGDRVAEVRMGQQYLTLAYRQNVDDEGGIGFDVRVPCPVDDECAGTAWAPAYSVTDLYRALTGDMDRDPGITCSVHGCVEPEDDDEAPRPEALL
ncbi:ATP-binding protein (plasmid) [Actinacidiphila glaucinigra]|uniref:ATP-binding protein n=1 Tax=Actinacidiphila glaucinigra TaxID=235986 RepID=UPI002DD94459|nr:ATP-binding protein [Actinacidiphila glaucinigra]WSD65858.1 ATP-binding protein [Actinacidiphila glaucinigra]